MDWYSGLRAVIAGLALAAVIGCAGTDREPLRAGATVEYGALDDDKEDVCDERSGWGQC